jgi:hypothetical protein
MSIYRIKDKLIGKNLYISQQSNVYNLYVSEETYTEDLFVADWAEIQNLYVAGETLFESGTFETATVNGMFWLGPSTSDGYTFPTSRGDLHQVLAMTHNGQLVFVDPNIISLPVHITATETAALQVNSGASIGGMLYIGGETGYSFTTTAGLEGQVLAMNTTKGMLEFVDPNIISLPVHITATETAALQVDGGASIGGMLYIGGETGYSFTTTAGLEGQVLAMNTTKGMLEFVDPNIISLPVHITATETAALQVDGGASIGGMLYIGGETGYSFTTTAGLEGQVLAMNTTKGMLEFVNQTGGSGIDLSNPVHITATETAALQVDGGASIGGMLYIGGETGYSFTTTAGLEGQVLAMNTTKGMLEFVNQTGGSGIDLSNPVHITATETAALQVNGGVSIGGMLYIGGETGYSFTTTAGLEGQVLAMNTTKGMLEFVNQTGGSGIDLSNPVHITATETAALQVNGGVSIGGTLNIGGKLYIDNIDTFNAPGTNPGNVYVGTDAVNMTNGTYNNAHGKNAGIACITGSYNNAFGGGALLSIQ